MHKAYWITMAAISSLLIAGASKSKHPTPTPATVHKQAATARMMLAPHISIYRPPCVEPQNHEQCDLEAQWKAVGSANRAAWWAIVQSIFSGLGIVGLLYSLFLTRRATNLAVAATQGASDALLIAERNAKSAAEQVDVARQTASAQLRAYLTVDNIEITYLSGAEHADLCVTFSNTGETPAIDIGCGGAAILWKQGKPIPSLEDFDEINSTDEGFLGSGYSHSFICKSQYTVDPESIVDGKLEGAMFVVSGQITYRDIFKAEHETSFKMIQNFNLSGKSFVFCNEGNNLT